MIHFKMICYAMAQVLGDTRRVWDLGKGATPVQVQPPHFEVRVLPEAPYGPGHFIAHCT